nr:immunoglobulin heavy chain junction region [Mus musculus]
YYCTRDNFDYDWYFD